MATWQDGPEYAPTARPSAFVEPAAVALDSTPPPVALENGVPGLEPSFVPPEQPTPDLRALVPSAAPGRNPNLPFESATTPLTAVEEAAAPRSPLQPFMTGGPSLAGYLPAQPVVQPTAQVNPVTLPMSMAQQWAPPAPATRVQGSVPVTVRQIWQATTGWVLVPLLIGMFLTPIAPVCLLVAGVSSAQVRHRRAAVRRAFSVSAPFGAAHFSQLSSGRHVGCGNEMSTNLPFACGSHATNAALSATSGRTTTGARTGRPFGVGGLQASIVPSSVRTRGDTRSMCVLPRRQPRHVPYCSLRAAMPQLAYVAISQFCAAVIPGDAQRTA